MKDRGVHVLNKTEEKVDELFDLGLSKLTTSVDQAKVYAKQALSLSLQADYKKGIAYSGMLLGAAKLSSSELKSTSPLLLESYEILVSLNDHIGLTRVCNYLGTYCYMVKHFDKATEWFLEGIDNAEIANNPKQKASIYNNLGTMFRDNKNIKKAKFYILKALAVAQEIDSVRVIGSAKTKLLSIHLEEENLEDAEILLGEIMELAAQTENKKLLSHYYDTLAEYQRKKGDIEASREAYVKCLEVLEDIGETSSICDILRELTAFSLENNDVEGAIHYGEEGLKRANESSYDFVIDSLSELLGDAYTLNRDFEKANACYKRRLDIASELNAQEIDRVSLELEQKYQAEKSELENNLLKKENELLEQKVELDNLIKQELAQSNQDLENFAHIASHDIKAPIRTIAQFAELLDEKSQNNLDEESKTYLEFILDSSKRIGILVDDILEYSKLNSQKINYSTAKTKDLLNEVIAVFAPRLEQEEIQLNIEEKLPEIEIDRIKMKRVFQNLIGNAIKFMDCERASTISISCAEENDKYIFSVKDTGIGIAETIKDIFQPFICLNNQSDYKGTGMGLALCKRIIEQHNGEIGYESEFGVGTRIYFSLPKNAPTKFDP